MQPVTLHGRSENCLGSISRDDDKVEIMNVLTARRYSYEVSATAFDRGIRDSSEMKALIIIHIMNTRIKQRAATDVGCSLQARPLPAPFEHLVRVT